MQNDSDTLDENAPIALKDEPEIDAFTDRRGGWLVIGGFFLLLALLVAVEWIRELF